MTVKASLTRQRILASAKAEFMEKGFSDASLRTIAKNAGVTTGALYGSFADKDSIFEALVGDSAAYFSQLFRDSQNAFQNLDPERQRSQMHGYSDDAMDRLVEYMFDNLDEFTLILCGATGSRYENWLEPLIEIEEKSTRTFLSVLKQEGYAVPDLSDSLIHILAGSFFHGVMETVSHRMDKESAKTHIHLLRKFSAAGWDALLCLRDDN